MYMRKDPAMCTNQWCITLRMQEYNTFNLLSDFSMSINSSMCIHVYLSQHITPRCQLFVTCLKYVKNWWLETVFALCITDASKQVIQGYWQTLPSFKCEPKSSSFSFKKGYLVPNMYRSCMNTTATVTNNNGCKRCFQFKIRSNW